MRKKLPSSFYNFTTLISTAVATVAFVISLGLIGLDSWRGFTNPYMGLVTYVALPLLMLGAIFIGFLGIVFTRRRLARNLEAKPYPVVDLNLKRNRFLVTWVGIIGIVLMIFSAFGATQAYAYTESVQFCGTTCHQVMGPEYTAYQHSSHAKIPCKECHIGPGAENYVQSKLAGTHQLYAAMTSSYNTPIPTPVKNLNSSKETCEHCHWTGQFYTSKMRTRIHYLSDETNTPHQISMLVKVGTTEQGKDVGIHSHMYLNQQITYASLDEQRQNIPWVEVKDANGNVTVYRDKENPIDDAKLKTLPRRTVDCTDCHNRPAHQFPHPDTSLSDGFTRGRLDITLPELKTAATDALNAPYKTKKEGLAGVEKSLREFYAKSYPEVAKAKAKSIDQAVTELKAVYARSYFPEMKADWRSHPDNLDHIHFNGCFRCHDDKHVSDTGRVISKDCQNCHLIVAQGKPGTAIPTTLKGQPFVHPEDIGDAWKDTPCKDCHGQAEEEEK